MRRSELLEEKLEFLKEHNGDENEIALLEKSLKRSKTGRKSKNKGAGFERKVVEKLNTIFPYLSFGRTASSGGYKKELDSQVLRGDVVSYADDYKFNLHLELKNVLKGWDIVKKWYKQASDDCIDGNIPTVIMHQAQEAGKYKSTDFILLKLDDFLEIVDTKKIIKTLDKK